jgi:two-component system, NtrC family, response regulator AtoC
MGHRISLLLVDDDAASRRVLEREFERRGHAVTGAASAEEALALATKSPPDVVLLDLKAAGAGGVAFLNELRRRDLDGEVVVVTGPASADAPAGALRRGAFECRQRPVDLDSLEALIERAAERRHLRAENAALRVALASRSSAPLVARSGAMQRLLQRLPRLAASNGAILIEGEAGTPKEALANALHRASPRAHEPFVSVDCAALQPAARGAELFGSEKAAANGEAARPGFVEASNRGTLFLDQIDQLDAEGQAALARVLEGREVRRAGSVRGRPVDSRLIAATSRRLGEQVEERRFREELWLRLQNSSLEIPPLRARREDILPLFTAILAGAASGAAPQLTERAQSVLLEYAWPGNDRELENLAGMLAAAPDHGIGNGTVDVTDLPPRFFSTRVAPTAVSGVPPLADVERRHILSVYEHAGRNKRRASELLGISLRTLYNKLTEYSVHGASREPAPAAAPPAGAGKP